jgi:hypothetical protein
VDFEDGFCLESDYPYGLNRYENPTMLQRFFEYVNWAIRLPLATIPGLRAGEAGGPRPYRLASGAAASPNRVARTPMRLIRDRYRLQSLRWSSPRLV